MDLDSLKSAGTKVVGVKQTTKALQKGTVLAVFIAADAEERITLPTKEACERQGIACISAETMQVLGKACGIHAGASVAAILKS